MAKPIPITERPATLFTPEIASPTTGNVALRLHGISKQYPGNAQLAVRDLSIEIRDGEIVTLLGPSGCGKTTTLRMAAGLEVPDEGDIYFGESPVVISSNRFFVPPDKRSVGMVTQSYATWPHILLAVRPDDVEMVNANGSSVPAGMISGKVQTALFVGDRIEYQTEVNGQGLILICGERHNPIDEGETVWLKLRPEGHTARASGES